MGTEEQLPQQQPQKTPLGEKIKQLPKTIKVFWKTPPKGRYLNLKEIACFAGSAFGMSTVVTVVSGLITATQIPTIYNFNVIHGAWICLIASVLGLIIQPFFSKLLQNTSTRFGRYKPFILLLAPMLAVFAILATWQPQYTDVNDRIIYAYCTCIPTLILWNLFQNTYYMLPGVVTPNQQERADIWAPIGLVIGFSPTVMNVLGNVIKGVFTEQGREYMAYRILGFVYAAVGLALVLCLFKVKERLIVTNENKEKVGLIEGLKMVVKNKPLMVLTLALILGCCRTVIEIDAEYIGRLRYAVTELGEIDVPTGLAIYGSLTLITGFAATPNMILLPLMTRKFNSRTIMMFWAACLFDIEIRLAKRNKACLMLMSICLFLLSLSMDPSTWVQALKAQYYMALGWMFKNVLKEGKLSWTVLKACIIAAIWVIMTNMGLCDTMNWPTYKFNGMADMIMPLFGILILIHISQALAALGRIKQSLLYLGRNTMSVMCLHFLGFKPAYLIMMALGRMSWSQFNLAVPPDIYYMTDIIFITSISVAASLMMWKLLGDFKMTRLLTGRWTREELRDFYDSLLIKELRNIYDIAKNIGTGIIKGYRADLMLPWKN